MRKESPILATMPQRVDIGLLTPDTRNLKP